jgi:hypothetical protein
MSPNVEIHSDVNPKSKKRIFFLCEDCMWGVTSLDKSRLFAAIEKDGTCPVCHQDQLSSFPVISNDSFTYCYSEKNGIEVQFSNRRLIKQISEIETAEC